MEKAHAMTIKELGKSVSAGVRGYIFLTFNVSSHYSKEGTLSRKKAAGQGEGTRNIILILKCGT